MMIRQFMKVNMMIKITIILISVKEEDVLHGDFNGIFQNYVTYSNMNNYVIVATSVIYRVQEL